MSYPYGANRKAFEIIGKDEILVNSRHKIHAKTICNLDLVAVADDGIDEIVEARDKKFFMGVQFHPESLCKNDVYMNNIFVGFLKACLEHKNSKETAKTKNNLKAGK